MPRNTNTAEAPVASSPEAANLQTPKYSVSELFETHKNKSSVIRFLSSEGLSVKEITKILQEAGITSANGTPIRYQHVRNVIKQPLKAASTSAASTAGGGLLKRLSDAPHLQPRGRGPNNLFLQNQQ